MSAGPSSRSQRRASTFFAVDRWTIGYALLLMTATTLPYLLGYARQGEDWAFTGFIFGVNDGNSYIAKMAEGARGAWLFTSPYTSELQRGAFVYPYFLALGKLAGPEAGLHEQLVAIFHIARILSGLALLLVTDRFLAAFLPSIQARRAGLVLASLGGGLGWALVLAGQGNLLGSLPLEFYSPEAFTFLDLFGLPHLSAARACLLAGLLAYQRAAASEPPPRTGASLSTPAEWRLRYRRLPDTLKPGLLFLLGGLIQPLTLIVAVAVLAMHLLLTTAAGLRDRDLRQASHTGRLVIATVAILLPLFAYNAVAFRLDPLLAQWARQNTIHTPHPLHYLVAYGLLALPAILGLCWLWRDARRVAEARFFLAWALALPLLLYAPFNLQRRLSDGFFVALVTLAMAGLYAGQAEQRGAEGSGEASLDLEPKKGAGLAHRLGVVTLLVLSLPSSVLLWAEGIDAALRLDEPAFVPRGEVKTFGFLGRELEPKAVVLSSFEVGNNLPAFAPQVAYLGHGPETLFFAEKSARVQAFFQSTTGDAARLETLRQGRVRYVFYGPHEAALGDYDLSAASFLRRIYSADEYAVYEFTG